MRPFSTFCLLMLCLLISWQTLPAQSPTPGENVNMVSGTKWPWGDPFLERQNEPQIAVSTRNPLHLIAGANDYRTVDLNLLDQLPTEQLAGDAWLGLFESLDGGRRWQSTLIPGYPQDASSLGMASPLHGLTTASDPVVRAGTNGMLYFGGIAFNRGGGQGVVFLSRFIDLNDREAMDITLDQSPIRYISTAVVANGNAAQFLDKPQIAVDIPRSGAGTCTMQVRRPDGTMVPQSFPAGTVYMTWAEFVGSQNLNRSKVRLSKSLDCGATWSNGILLSQTYAVNNGPSIAVDPETGYVYVAWRVAAAASNPDAIVVAKSTDGGNTFSKAVQVVGLQPYNASTPNAPSLSDQQTTQTEFRSLAFPTLTVDDSGVAGVPGRVYLAWSQRGAMQCMGQPPLPVASDAKIVMSTSPDGVAWSNPCAVDTGAISDDAGAQFSRGNQIMPAMTFIEGKLMLTYVDQRLDHTEGLFTPQLDASGSFFSPDSAGKFFHESRDPEGEPDASGTPIFTPFIDDSGLASRRHTIDVNLAQSSGGANPSFTFARISSYDFGLFFDEKDTKFHQLKFNPPNLPMFAKGTAPFMGDYIDIAGQMFVPLSPCATAPQCWAFNNPNNSALLNSSALKAASASSPTSSPVHYATWTTNQDVIPPFNGDWTQFFPITGNPPAPSVFNGTPTAACQPNTGFEGDRNQNIYDSRITQGLLVSSPQVSKPLSKDVQRGFVVLVQNFTSGRAQPPVNGQPPNFVNYFRLTIAGNQPRNGFASFQQLVPPSPVPATFPSSVTVNGTVIPFPLTSVDVAIAPHSGVARTVFAVSDNPTASITVNVQEIDGLGGNPLAGGLSSFVVLNADGTVPANLVDPNGVNGSSGINGVELYSPNITGPNITGPNITGPNITGPNITGPNITGSNCGSPNITGSGCTAPNITGPNITGPNITGSTIANPNITGSNVAAPNITGSSVADATYIVGGSNANNGPKTGNTHSGQHVKLVGSAPVPLQVTVTQIYTTPNTDGQCHLIDAQQNIVLANAPNATFTPIDQLGSPNITGSAVSDVTFDLGPNDTAYITVRAQNTTLDQMAALVTQFTPVVVPEAINSNNTTDTTPTFVSPLFITTAALPDGVVGQAYGPPPILRVQQFVTGVQLSNIGGTAPFIWTASNLPAGLTLSPSGVLSGTPTVSNLPGAAVTFRIQDSLGAAVTRVLTIRIADPLAVTTTLLANAVQGAAYGPVQFTTTGGIPPFTWVQVGIDGLLLTSSGTFSGIPTNIGSIGFTATVSDSSSPAQFANGLVTLAVVPAAPTGLTAVALATGSVSLAWNASTSVVSGYNVYRSTASGGPFTKLTPQGTAALSFIDSTGIGGQTYFYVVTAFGPNNLESFQSNEVSALVAIVPVFVGQATDPIGDALGGGNNPDLVSATITVFNSNTATLSVRFAAGTFNSATTSAEVLVDTDQNVQTGLPGIDGGCSAPDSTLIGTDYIVDMGSGFANNQASILASTSNACPPQLALVGNAAVTIQTDGMDVSVPLAMLTGATAGAAPRGPWNFKATTSTFLGNGFTAILDRMPDTGVAPASTGPPLQ